MSVGGNIGKNAIGLGQVRMGTSDDLLNFWGLGS